MFENCSLFHFTTAKYWIIILIKSNKWTVILINQNILFAFRKWNSIYTDNAIKYNVGMQKFLTGKKISCEFYVFFHFNSLRRNHNFSRLFSHFYFRHHIILAILHEQEMRSNRHDIKNPFFWWNEYYFKME